MHVNVNCNRLRLNSFLFQVRSICRYNVIKKIYCQSARSFTWLGRQRSFFCPRKYENCLEKCKWIFLEANMSIQTIPVSFLQCKTAYLGFFSIRHLLKFSLLKQPHLTISIVARNSQFQNTRKNKPFYRISDKLPSHTDTVFSLSLWEQVVIQTI